MSHSHEIVFTNVLYGHLVCKNIHQPGFEPGTFCVLSRRHNQLDHRCL